MDLSYFIWTRNEIRFNSKSQVAGVQMAMYQSIKLNQKLKSWKSNHKENIPQESVDQHHR